MHNVEIEFWFVQKDATLTGQQLMGERAVFALGELLIARDHISSAEQRTFPHPILGDRQSCLMGPPEHPSLQEACLCLAAEERKELALDAPRVIEVIVVPLAKIIPGGIVYRSLA
jgi:hypothetical protein